MIPNGPCEVTAQCIEGVEVCDPYDQRCVNAADPQGNPSPEIVPGATCNTTSQCEVGYQVCSPTSHKYLDANVPFGYQCEISDQCAQGYSYQQCCNSEKCGACHGVTGAACSSRSDCNSGLDCISRDSRQDVKTCTPTDGSEKSPCQDNADCKDNCHATRRKSTRSRCATPRLAC